MTSLYLLAATTAILTNTAIHVPASHWTAVRLQIREPEAVVEGSFHVVQGSRVQLLITDRQQAERFHRGRSFTPLYSSGFQTQAHFQTTIRQPGEYVLLIDNRIDARGSAVVELSVREDSRHVLARELPPARRHAVVALSALFFGSVLVFSARQFLKRNRDAS